MNGHLFLCSNAYTKTRSRLLYFIQHIHNCHFNIKSTRKFLMRYFCIHVVFEIGCVSLTAHLSSDWPHFKCSVATCDQWLPCWTVQTQEVQRPSLHSNANIYTVRILPPTITGGSFSHNLLLPLSHAPFQY